MKNLKFRLWKYFYDKATWFLICSVDDFNYMKGYFFYSKIARKFERKF